MAFNHIFLFRQGMYAKRTLSKEMKRSSLSFEPLGTLHSTTLPHARFDSWYIRKIRLFAKARTCSTRWRASTVTGKFNRNSKMRITH